MSTENERERVETPARDANILSREMSVNWFAGGVAEVILLVRTRTTVADSICKRVVGQLEEHYAGSIPIRYTSIGLMGRVRIFCRREDVGDVRDTFERIARGL